MTSLHDAIQAALPADAADAALAGRIWRPDLGGPSVVAIRAGSVVDISRHFPTMRDLCEAAAPAAALRSTSGDDFGPLDAILANTPIDGRDPDRP